MTTESLDPPAMNVAPRDSGFNVRTLSLVGLLFVIAVTFHLLSGGLFLTARNLYNIVVQTSVVAILACGMTIVIVTRNIDLSVGSVLGCVGMVIALLQIQIFPQEAAWNWPLTVVIGLALGALIGAWHGFWIAYLGVPSFVVTLGGLLIFRGAAFEVAQGKTLAPFDPIYRLFGGGIDGALGVGPSWMLFVVIMVLYGLGEILVHRRQTRLGFHSKARAKVLRFALVLVAAAAFVATMNSYLKPRSDIGRGVPIPALVLLSVVLFMEFVTRFTTFGRYIFAIGGNIDAARLNGIPTRRTVLVAFITMGVLCAIAAVVTTARLNAGTSSTGELLELSAIAAAVIGGASLSGGRGTIAGAVVGALIIQSLESGMVLIGASSSQRMVAIGLVLMAAVFADKYLSGEE
ncbi:D-xylose transport system permease protein [Aliiruegeria haliotis]|uniref:Xylose transport system permease protein XylH n=1 Tax=Aliiruegeria haliotis TaxID=1280846 RepID=A0A2T0RLY1_9RHOB|nr:sugar ABC transporter permease [Aliiruegeria haliotis]PRY22199.1 D-xylose transport system permease protein [Aliiruegeria haliotis]